MKHRRKFNPDTRKKKRIEGGGRESALEVRGAPSAAPVPEEKALGDHQATYVYSDHIVLMVNAAMAAKRPLLLRGDPGTGKSSLARDVADVLDWDYEQEVITSRTQAQDLMWRFDAVRRLSDAHAGLLKGERAFDLTPYINSGVLWRAFSPSTVPVAEKKDVEAKAGTVVLLDEIDKADPDVPNDLLVPLGSGQFTVRETGQVVEVKDRKVLVFITTNNERDLPEAFLRRCLVLKLEPPKDLADARTRRDAIARAHFPEIEQAVLDFVDARFEALKDAAAKAKSKLRVPGMAEFLDAIRAASELHPEDWSAVVDAAIWKHDTAPPPREAQGAARDKP